MHKLEIILEGLLYTVQMKIFEIILRGSPFYALRHTHKLGCPVDRSPMLLAVLSNFYWLFTLLCSHTSIANYLPLTVES